MRESFWNIDCAMIIFGQFNFNMLEVGRAFRAKVDNDVNDGAPCTTYCFCLRRWRKLKVHSPKRTFVMIEGYVSLGDRGLQSMRSKFLLAESSCEDPAIVASRLDLNDISTFQCGLGKNHIPSEVSKLA